MEQNTYLIKVGVEDCPNNTLVPVEAKEWESGVFHIKPPMKDAKSEVPYPSSGDKFYVFAHNLEKINEALSWGDLIAIGTASNVEKRGKYIDVSMENIEIKKYVQISISELGKLKIKEDETSSIFYKIRKYTLKQTRLLSEPEIAEINEFLFEVGSDSDIYSDTLDLRNENIGETERNALLSARIGQGKFREDLKYLYSNKCSVTGIEYSPMLRASHIKPWRDCNNSERLDPHNGFLLTPNLDHAFDRFLISFKESGSILISPKLEAVAPSLGITEKLKLVPISSKTKKYLQWHRSKYEELNHP